MRDATSRDLAQGIALLSEIEKGRRRAPFAGIGSLILDVDEVGDRSIAKVGDLEALSACGKIKSVLFAK